MTAPTAPPPTRERPPGPRIDPRIARRWVEVRREQGRRRLKVVLAVSLVLLALVLVAGSLYTPLFKVRHVRVTVSGNVAPATVVALAGFDHQRLMVHVDDAAVEGRLDAVPQLGAAAVSTHWPGTVSIFVVVRSAVAVVQTTVPGGSPRWAEIDPTGRVLALVAAPPAGMPLLDGVGTPPAAGQWLVGAAGPSAPPARTGSPALADMSAASDSPSMPSGAAAGLAVAAALSPQLRGQVQSITAGPVRALTLKVVPTRMASGSIQVDLGDGSRLAAKLTALATMLGQADLAGVTRLDLTVPDRPAALTGTANPGSLSTHAGG